MWPVPMDLAWASLSSDLLSVFRGLRYLELGCETLQPPRAQRRREKLDLGLALLLLVHVTPLSLVLRVPFPKQPKAEHYIAL